MTLAGVASAAGVAGVLLILLAYAAGQIGRLNPLGAKAAGANLIGACLILWSLAYDFNLSAVLMEGSWALVSLLGLVNAVVRRRW